MIPDCRCNGASLRYWEAQYDVMLRINMMNSPHGWSGWTGYAKYYLYLLTGKKEYLVDLLNLMGSCVQLVDESGELRWSYCSQPYIKGRMFVPDVEKPVKDGYRFVESDETAYRGKYVASELCEGYIPMISGWYRVGEQKVVGGYEFCPLIMDGYQDEKADRQGGCCDNDVHEIFKCMEETVLGKQLLRTVAEGLQSAHAALLAALLAMNIAVEFVGVFGILIGLVYFAYTFQRGKAVDRFEKRFGK